VFDVGGQRIDGRDRSPDSGKLHLVRAEVARLAEEQNSGADPVMAATASPDEAVSLINAL